MHFKDFFVKIAIFITVDVYFIKVISKAEKYFIFQLPTLWFVKIRFFKILSLKYFIGT